MSRMRRAIQNSYDLLDTTDTEIAKKRIRVSNPRYHHNSEPGVLKEKHPSRQKVKKLDDVRRGPIPAPPPSPFQPVSQKTNAPNSKKKIHHGSCSSVNIDSFNFLESNSLERLFKCIGHTEKSS